MIKEVHLTQDADDPTLVENTVKQTTFSSFPLVPGTLDGFHGNERQMKPIHGHEDSVKLETPLKS